MALGKLGGSANTPAQNKARAKNAKKGGWPKGRSRKTKSAVSVGRGVSSDAASYNPNQVKSVIGSKKGKK